MQCHVLNWQFPNTNKMRQVLFSFVFLCSLVINIDGQPPTSCSDFQILEGVDVDISVKWAASGPWNNSTCSAASSKSIMIMPTTVEFGAALCNMYPNSYPWAGISYKNTTPSNGNWSWVDGTNTSARRPFWDKDIEPSYFQDCDGGECGPAVCGEVSCNAHNYGRLYSARCNKPQGVICQLKCKHYIHSDV
jgi:hypothetical protein